jgi:hypothetical protein
MLKIGFNLRNVAAGVACLTVAAVFSSCGGDDKKNGDPNLGVELESLTFEAIPAGTQSVKVTSDIAWSVAIPQADDWLSVSKKNGNGNDDLVFTAKTNTGEARNTMVTVSGTGAESKAISVMQKASSATAAFNYNIGDTWWIVYTLKRYENDVLVENYLREYRRTPACFYFMTHDTQEGGFFYKSAGASVYGMITYTKTNGKWITVPGITATEEYVTVLANSLTGSIMTAVHTTSGVYPDLIKGAAVTMLGRACTEYANKNNHLNILHQTYVIDNATHACLKYVYNVPGAGKNSVEAECTRFQLTNVTLPDELTGFMN